MTQDGDLPGGLHYDGTVRDVQVGPMTGIVRYYPVPAASKAVTPTPWWRHALLFTAGLLLGVVLTAVAFHSIG